VEDTAELQNQSFDVISMWHVLEHVPNLDNQIKKLKRLLKPNGSLIVAVQILNLSTQNIMALLAAYDVPIHFGIFKKTIKHFDKKGCNWKSAPDEI
jgi:2-polyprenyl-3-methyl-5-hydroxy-6-metoxy-1,4-benzoquinol methylase